MQISPRYTTILPFPQWLKKSKEEKRFARYLENFKKLEINIPFLEVLEKMPHYTKNLKDIITNKEKVE